MNSTFTFNGLEFPYAQEPLKPVGSGPHRGERTIEVPLAKWVLSRWPMERTIEVGCVMGYWRKDPAYGIEPPHRILDPFDPWIRCERIDGESFDFAGWHVLCVSTLEHMGTGEYGNRTIDPDKPMRCYDKIIAESDAYFLTVPIGYNHPLDRHIARSAAPKYFMKQTTRYNTWEQQPRPSWALEYNNPFPYANGVVIVTNVEFAP